MSTPSESRQSPDRPGPELLVMAYERGIFPMGDPDTGEVDWYSPDPRAIIPLDDAFHVPRSVARIIRAGRFQIRHDVDFSAVMRACAAPRPGEPETWIDEQLVAAYSALADRGIAHSVEAWRAGERVGGLYGVHLAGAFFGESMYHRPDLGGRDASKVCLVALVDHLRAIGAVLLDTQFMTPHLARFGAHEIRRSDYLARLRRALDVPADWRIPARAADARLDARPDPSSGAQPRA
ncbi:MAG: leucyl/phenylalanyl-tRNA--protein transferase [Phycisphaerales bacterium]